MSKNRLFSLLIALSLAIFALIATPPVAQADDCWQFNTSLCLYYWNPDWGCCVSNAPRCIMYCL